MILLSASGEAPPPGDGPLAPPERADVETASEGYARRFAGPVGAWFLEVQARATLALLAPWPGCSVVDVGGGHAQTAAPLAERGFAVTVLGSRDACRERLDRLLPAGGFEFVRCDLLDLPFPDRSFDVALAYRLLSHEAGWRRLLGEMCRVARRAVLVDYTDSRSVNRLAEPLFGLKRKAEGNTRPYYRFRRSDLVQELARHGFGEPAVVKEFFVPMVLHRIAGKKLGAAGPSRAAEAVARRLGLTRAFGSPAILRVVRGQGAGDDLPRRRAMRGEP